MLGRGHVVPEHRSWVEGTAGHLCLNREGASVCVGEESLLLQPRAFTEGQYIE